jgi:hypothetical protein
MQHVPYAECDDNVVAFLWNNKLQLTSIFDNDLTSWHKVSTMGSLLKDNSIQQLLAVIFTAYTILAVSALPLTMLVGGVVVLLCGSLSPSAKAMFKAVFFVTCAARSLLPPATYALTQWLRSPLLLGIACPSPPLTPSITHPNPFRLAPTGTECSSCSCLHPCPRSSCWPAVPGPRWTVCTNAGERRLHRSRGPRKQRPWTLQGTTTATTCVQCCTLVPLGGGGLRWVAASTQGCALLPLVCMLWNASVVFFVVATRGAA